MAQPGKKSARSTKQKSKKSVPEFAKPFYKKRWFAIAILILLFSGIGGGYMIRKGNAASYTFISRNGDIRHTRPENKSAYVKRDGIVYYLVAQASTFTATTIETTPSATASASSSRYCAHYKVFKAPEAGKTAKIWIYYSLTESGRTLLSTSYSATITSSTTSGNVCVPKQGIRADKIFVGATLPTVSIGVDTIYGKP